MSMMENQIKPKSFWNKPEGKTGMLVAGAGVVGFGLLMYKIGPML